MYPRLLAAGLTLLSAVYAATLTPAQLRCEQQTDPLAVQTPHPRLGWLLKPIDPSRHALRQSAYQILVASSTKLLAQNRGDLWDTGKIESNRTFHLAYHGKNLAPQTEYFWKVRIWDQDNSASQWSSPARWRMGLWPDDWKAKWIAAPLKAFPPQEMPIFRRSFRLHKHVASAIVSISGLGQYELSINGNKVGDQVLTPGWTNYRKTVFYNTYDVTSALKSGENALGVMLGNGMYNVVKTPGRYTKFVGSFGEPMLLAQLHVLFTDGTRTDIVTDSNWKAHAGPIVFSSTYGGEDYDARLDVAGWESPGFDDRSWIAARETSGPGGTLVSQMNPAIKVIHIYRPVKITEPKPGVRVYDLGQNFSGWPQITVSGTAGTTVKLIPGELLDGEGLVTQRSSGGPQWFSYTLKGNGREIWHPRFSYYGFRYVQVEGATGKTRLLALEGQFIHSSAPRVGEFSCSKPLFNRIHALIDAAIESNMQSVLTDCPHREKLGWLEESHLLGSAIMYNYNVERLYQKIADDIRDSQTADGLVPDIAPEYVVFSGGFRDSPEWGSAVVLDPWLTYRHYGNRDILEQHYGEMRRYVDYLSGKAKDGIISYGLGDWYDIGPKAPGSSQLTSLGLTATAIYYDDLITLRRAALVLEKQEDADHFAAMADSVRARFNANLFDPKTGIYDRGSQTAYAMPLALGMVPKEHRAEVLNRLVEDIRKHRNHTTAGDIGFHFVLQALSEGGRSDVIYDMLSTTDSPSYGYQLAKGATTLTEAWDSNPHSSQNHFMLGHAEEWFYRSLAGIDFDLSRAPGERIILRPAIVGDIASAHASYRTVLGTIISGWKRESGRLLFDVTIPPNTSATVFVPSRTGIQVHHVDSGRYHFETME